MCKQLLNHSDHFRADYMHAKAFSKQPLGTNDHPEWLCETHRPPGMFLENFLLPLD